MSTPIERTAAVSGRLARLGFSRTGDAAALLSGPTLGLWDERANAPADDGAAAIVSALSRAADPDQAVAGLVALVRAGGPEVLQALRGSGDLRSRLLSVLGASRALVDHLGQHPDHWRVLEAPDQGSSVDERARSLHTAIGANADDPVTGSSGAPARITGRDGAQALAAEYRRQLLGIAGRDLSGEAGLDETAEALSDLAVAALSAALALAAAERPARVPFRLAVIALGKTGGRELNYVSDIDVVFVAESGAATAGAADATGSAEVDEQTALADATRLASGLMRVCRDVLWEVDAGLRPEGKNGPLVRTLASHRAYYERWASTWEFQALLKARPAAGDAELWWDYLQAVSPMVWEAAERDNFVPDVQAMRRRVVAHLSPEVASREIKLGAGGLRDVEFAIQLLQLVHGRSDETLRSPTTMTALAALRDGGYVGRDDATSLADAYRFLRATEHRLQLTRLRRTHLLPEDETQLLHLARAMGYRPDARGDALAVFRSEWQLHVREVRRLHEKLFYRPLLESVARVPTDELRLSPAEAEKRLAALGFDNPRGALGHIQALTSGLSRRAAIQRTLLPVLLADFSNAPDPDAGLLGYRQLSDAMGKEPWFLRTLRDEGRVADRLATVLGTSRFVTTLLVGAPASLRVLADDERLQPRTADQLRQAMTETAARQDDPAARVRAVRALRRAELVRIAAADVLGVADLDAVQAGLSAVMDAVLDMALTIAVVEVGGEHALEHPPARLAVLAAGRLGGRELGYGSDADVLFVHEHTDDPAAEGEPARFAHAVFERMRALLAAPGPDPAVQVDADLRPEGRDGPLSRTVESYAAYYQRWAAVWEFQALLRVRPCAGDPALAARLCAAIDPVRYPAHGLSAEQVLEIRRIKGRVDSERLPRGADPATNTKLGRGGLGDVEWTIQLLQLQHAHRVAALRTPSTLDALAAAADADLLTPEQAGTLREAWRSATRARNAIMLARGKPGDQLPTPGPALIGVGRVLGHPAGFDPGELDNDYRRLARRARRVVEDVFYDRVAPQASLDAADPSASAGTR